MALLKINDLRVTYGQVEAIHGIDMQVETGSITAIIGSNGAGKTTILNAISGMVKRTGAIEFDSKPMSGKNHRKEIDCLISEQYKLFPRLKERRKQDAGTLSGGEQQMLVICRALMSKPRVLLLDEPSLGLAPIVVKDVFNTICSVREQGITVVLVEQNAKKSLCICDYGYVIENGNIACEGSGKELLNNPAIARAYLGADRNCADTIC